MTDNSIPVCVSSKDLNKKTRETDLHRIGKNDSDVMGWMVNALIFLVSHTAILWPKWSSSCKIPAAPQFYGFRIVNRKAKGSTPIERTQRFFFFVLYAAVTNLKKIHVPRRVVLSLSFQLSNCIFYKLKSYLLTSGTKVTVYL